MPKRMSRRGAPNPSSVPQVPVIVKASAFSPLVQSLTAVAHLVFLHCAVRNSRTKLVNGFL